MKAINKLIKNYKNNYISFLYDYVITIVLLGLGSIVSVFVVDRYNIDEIFRSDLVTTIGLFVAGSFFLETIYKRENEKKPWKKIIIGEVIALDISILLTIIRSYSADIARVFNKQGILSSLVVDYIGKFLCFYGIALVLISIYILVKRSTLEFHVYFARKAIGVLKLLGVLLVIHLVALMILAVYDCLVDSLDVWMYIDQINVFFIGVIFLPFLIYILASPGEENSRFTKCIFNYILMPCVFASIGIVYLSIGKMIHEGAMPEREVFSICISFFMACAPVSLISYGFFKSEEEKTGKPMNIYGKVVKYVPYGFIPFIIVEIIALGIRIGDFGLTENRYLGIIAIIFQIIYVLWCVFNLNKDKLLIIATILIGITLVCPVINARELGFRVQKSLLEKAVENDDLEVAIRIYDYLSRDIYGEEYIADCTDWEDRNSLIQTFSDETKEEYYFGDEKKEAHIFVDSKPSEEGLKVEGFTNVYNLYYSTTTTDDRLSEDNRVVTIDYEGGSFELDLTELIDKYIEDAKKYIMENNRLSYYTSDDFEYIEISPTCTIKIDEFDYYYSYETKEAYEILIRGSILTIEEKENE